VSVPPGNSTSLREFIKDGSATSGSDSLWINDLEVGVDDWIWTDIAPKSLRGAPSAQWTTAKTGVSFKIKTRVQNADGSHGAWDESDDMFEVSEGDTIPTVSEWGMMVMTLLALTGGSMVFRQHRRGWMSNMPNGLPTR